jgi:hypothetical protein
MNYIVCKDFTGDFIKLLKVIELMKLMRVNKSFKALCEAHPAYKYIDRYMILYRVVNRRRMNSFKEAMRYTINVVCYVEVMFHEEEVTYRDSAYIVEREDIIWPENLVFMKSDKIYKPLKFIRKMSKEQAIEFFGAI